MLRGKDRKNTHTKLEVDEEDLYILKINCKGKRTVGKANGEINVEKIQQVKKIKLKLEKKEKKMEE